MFPLFIIKKNHPIQIPCFSFFIRAFVLLFGLVLISMESLYAQFPPAAGQAGSTAIAADSEELIAWGTGCIVTRGWQDIAVPDSGYTSAGEADFAIGKPDNRTISLGDAGQAVLTFEHPISNGEGWDFAVFENGFDNTFLELALVEVSSDGEHFYRFPATSLTDTTAEIGTFGLLDATQLHNLAGKYRLLQGTPFDLEELSHLPDLDIQHITHLKLIDVVGSMDENDAMRDAQGHKIVDPYPTNFPQGGFDLDAVGVRYQNVMDGITEMQVFEHLNLYPNPVQRGETLQIAVETDILDKNIMIELYQSNGFFIKKLNGTTLNTSTMERGAYFFRIISHGLVHVKQFFIF